jgi:hypothetical protein
MACNNAIYPIMAKFATVLPILIIFEEMYQIKLCIAGMDKHGPI